MDMNYLAENLPLLVKAAWVTVWLTALTLFLSTVIALPLSVVGLTRPTLVSRALDIATLLLRSLPTLVILFFFYYGLPQFGIVLSPFPVAVIGLTLSAVAYNIEIFRSGLRAVDPGQIEAGRALGLPSWRIWVQIIFPQALPIFTPTYLSNATLVLKGTSVASIITIPELTSVANEIVSMTYQPFEILITAALMYILMGGVLSLAAQGVRWNMARRLASPPVPVEASA